jgi:limonene-1,2-epoxide hydrolase
MTSAPVEQPHQRTPIDMTLTRIHAMFHAVDAMATSDFVSYLTPDVRFRFGNAPEICGRSGVSDALGIFFQQIDGLSHQVTGCWEQGETVIVRLDVTYRRLDGDRVSLPCVNVFEYDDGLIKDYRIYMDVSPAMPSLS